MPKVIQVIESVAPRGTGQSVASVLRGVTQYHSLEGDLLAESDPCPNPGMVAVPQEALDWLNGEHVDGFEKPIGAKGDFWWRTEFLKRAGL